ncbi:MAG: response regulator [Syntrophomonadaceae bacterium]|nr:response regulator [Syntrophomonadaceae bacterium]
MARIRVLIVDDVDETRQSIKRLLQFEASIKIVGEASSGAEAIRQAEVLKPDVILMDINMPGTDGLTATEAISTSFPFMNIIIISVQGETEYIKRAMLAGAREYLVKPFTGEELVNTIRQVYRLEKIRHSSYQSIPATVQPVTNPQVVTVFSNKGGVGKTTISVNLAVALQQAYKARVVLVDLDLQFGDVGVMLNLVPSRTMVDLITEGGEITPGLIDEYLEDKGELNVLSAPLKPEYAELVNGAQVEKFIKALSQLYEFIVIDTAATFNEVTLTALDLSNLIFLVGTQDLPTIKNLRLSLEVLEALHHTGKTRLVVNRQSSEMGIKTDDLERALNFQVSCEIPNEVKTVISAINRGIPFVEAAPQARVSQAIRKLAAMVKEHQESMTYSAFPARRGLLGRLVGR